MGQQARQFEITVLTGLNAGVELPLPSGRHSIGGAETDDIQLDGIADTLADFALERDCIRIKPRVSSIHTKTEGSLAQDKIAKLRLPARISLTPEIDIFADAIAAPAKKRRFLKPLLAVASVVVAAIALTAVQVDFRFSATQATPSITAVEATARPSPRAFLQTAQATETASTICTDCAADAASDLRKTLAEAGLVGLVVASSGGAVRVEGGMSAENRVKWTAIRSGFDGKWPMVPLLLSFSEAKNGAPLSVVSVWLGEPREVRIDTGETIKIGDVIADGWTLSAIEPEYVELMQGETMLRVTY